MGKSGFESVGKTSIKGNFGIFKELNREDLILGYGIDSKFLLCGGTKNDLSNQVLGAIMESIFGEEFDLEESFNDFQEESSDIQEITEIEVTEDLNFCRGELDRSNTIEEPLGKSKGEALEPSLGMEFKSRDSARDFYVSYGRHVGFTVRSHHSRRSKRTDAVISQDFVCSKEGFREKKYVERKDRVLPPTPVTREGCRAVMRVTLKEGGKWVLTKFVKDHSHKLMSPGALQWRRSDKVLLTEDQKDKKIKELTLELHNEKRRCERRCAAYQEQLQMVLKDIETHTEHLSKRVKDVVQNIKAIEEEE
ncbi:hypothetical protein GIB67_024510 [Kingdonia uniflora]|uniref:FAR1 domain-containing protein n=1 Tax=Kingdonia uniflora TaxID=39325 RepID=A0A7J7LNS4_9MAGN|nr:hypothetical protein GIB67_024510 [Kingdonia uniflora]